MTLTILRTFIETDLPDSALTVILAAADEDITSAVGPDVSMIEEQEMEGDLLLFLRRPAISITTITEMDSSGTVLPLATNDYRLHPSQTYITRLTTGTNPREGWFGTVTIIYAPGDLNARNRALMDLVQLQLDFRHGKTSEGIGDHHMTQEGYDKARARILSQAVLRWFA